MNVVTEPLSAEEERAIRELRAIWEAAPDIGDGKALLGFRLMEQAFDLLPRLLATLDAARRQSAATLDGWRDAAELRRDAARADGLREAAQTVFDHHFGRTNHYEKDGHRCWEALRAALEDPRG